MFVLWIVRITYETNMTEIRDFASTVMAKVHALY